MSVFPTCTSFNKPLFLLKTYRHSPAITRNKESSSEIWIFDVPDLTIKLSATCLGLLIGKLQVNNSFFIGSCAVTYKTSYRFQLTGNIILSFPFSKGFIEGEGIVPVMSIIVPGVSFFKR